MHIGVTTWRKIVSKIFGNDEKRVLMCPKCLQPQIDCDCLCPLCGKNTHAFDLCPTCAPRWDETIQGPLPQHDEEITWYEICEKPVSKYLAWQEDSEGEVVNTGLHLCKNCR